MATGFKGQGFRKKTWSATYSNGTTVVYTVPSDVVAALPFISSIEGDNIDTSESITLKGQRLVQGTWRDLGNIATLAAGLGTNLDIGTYVTYSYPSAAELTYSVTDVGTGSGAFTLQRLQAGDRIVAVVATSGETFDVVGYVLEETATTTSI